MILKINFITLEILHLLLKIFLTPLILFFGIDCKLAMNLSIYKLMIDSLGSETFNKLICKSIFKHLIFDISSFQVLNYLNCKIEDEFESFHSGHLYYLRGYKDYLKFHPLGEWQGHWVFCVSHSPALFIGYQLKCPITLSELTDLFIFHTNKNLSPSICFKDDFTLSVEDHYDLT